MSSNDWQEVKRLAADFQRAQLSSNLQQLTEGNCVEIVSKLKKLRLLDVVFTNDGKTFVTQLHLMKEIKDELYVHGGRLSIIDTGKSLNVDVDVISSLIQDLLKSDSKLCVILGQLIDQSYITHIAEDINEKLQQRGYINVSDLTRVYDLPGDFIQSIIKDNIGKVITNTKQNKLDTYSYYTDSYFARNKAIIRGAVLAITKPTLLSSIMAACKVDEHLFHSMLDSLIDSKQIPGCLTDRFGSASKYVPYVHSRKYSELVRNTFKQNCYIDYDVLIRGEIAEPKIFISNVLPDEKLIFLKNFVIGQHILDRIEATMDDLVLSSNLWVDLTSILPMEFEVEDLETIIEIIMKKSEFSGRSTVFCIKFIVSHSFLNALNSSIADKLVISNAEKMVSSGMYENYVHKSKISQMNNKMPELSRREERKKTIAVGKSGGGTRGRETKTKSVKKKYGQKTKYNDSDHEDENENTANNSTMLEIVNMEEIMNIISDHSTFVEEQDCKELIIELTNYFYPIINNAALEKCKVLYEAHLMEHNSSRRKTNAVLQDTMLSLYQDVRLYQKGVKQLADNADVEQQLNKYLLKTTGTQLVNSCFALIGECDDIAMTAEDRIKILNKTNDADVKKMYAKLNKSLNGGSVDEFLISVEDTFSSINIMIKKQDKKKEKSLLESHKKALLDKLSETNDPPLILHLVCTILFQEASQTMINVSGRFVSNIMKFLKPRMTADTYRTINTYHGLVLKTLTISDKDSEILEQLDKLMPEVKRLTYTNEVIFI